MGNIIFEIKNRAENAINMHDKSEFKEPLDVFEMTQILEEQLRLHNLCLHKLEEQLHLHEEGQQEQQQLSVVIIKEKAFAGAGAGQLHLR